MIKIKEIYLTAWIILIGGMVHAQDPHFSQYFSSPLTLNPANTGNFDGPYRLASNFRNQWQGVGNPYLTGTISFDAAIAKDRFSAGDNFSVGFLGLFDKAMGGSFNSNYGGISVGYHLFLDEDRMHKLSIGFQSVLVNKRLDPTEISFATQFSSNGFDLSLPSDEFFQNNNINYLDWNTGLNYTYANEGGTYHVGFSGYHLTRPQESFLGDEANVIPIRYSLTAGANRYMGETGVLMTSALFQQQARSRELTLGLAYGQYLSSPGNDISVFMGAWYRLNDSFIPYFGFNYNDLQIGLSYDVIASSLNLSKTNNRSIEISAIYSFRDKSTDKRFIPWY